jgi:DNA modification methylase
MSYKSIWDFGRAGKANYSVHGIGEYPSKIRPIVISKIVERFSEKGDTILDPFCGGGTVPVEAKIQGRNSISYDIVPNAVELTKRKLNALTNEEMKKITTEFIKEYEKELETTSRPMEKTRLNKEIKKLNEKLNELKGDNSQYYKTTHPVDVKDARELDLDEESVDAVITDIPYASMIKYSELPQDLSAIQDYLKFLDELKIAFEKAGKALKKGKYFVVFVADYRVGASRLILPVHSDIIQIMRSMRFDLFDTYIWRYYRSGAFRPFGKKPYQAMNLHIYILCFYKPTGNEIYKPNRPIRYRNRLIEKIENNKN